MTITRSLAKLAPRVRRWTPWLRFLVSAGLIYLILRQTSLTEIGAVVARTLDHWPLLLIAALLPLLGTLFACFRWRVLIGGTGTHPGIPALFKAILVGAFFNYFLPSTIGGDVARSLWMRRTLGSATLSVTIVGLDRLVGLVGICALGLLAALFQPVLVSTLPHFWIVIAVIALGVGALVVLYHPSARVVGRWAFSLPGLRAAREQAATAYGGLVSLRDGKRRLAAALLFSIGLQSVLVLEYAVFADVLDSAIPPTALAVLIPIVMLITLLPISINGIGLREGALALLGAPLGLTLSDAVAMAWLFIAVQAAYALAGGLIYTFARRGGP